MTNATRSHLFTAYNAARNIARRGDLDPKRVNKALGIAQSADPSNPYGCTEKVSRCPDAICRPGTICKHRIALALVAEAESL